MDSFYRDLIVSLCMLNDDPGFDKKRNACFSGWLQDFKPSDAQDANRLKEAIVAFKERMAPITRMRHKHIAHKNRSFLGTSSPRPDSVSRKHLRAVLDKMHVVVKLLFETNGLKHLHSDANRFLGGPKQLLFFVSNGLSNLKDAPLQTLSGASRRVQAE